MSEPLTNLEKLDSKFRFVHVASRRARQLMSGAPQVIHSLSKKPTRVAQEEMLAGLIEYEAAPLPTSKAKKVGE